MSSYLKSENQGELSILTIDRQDAQNALNIDVLTELKDAVHKLGQEKKTKVILITGAGDRAFCAGADIAVMKDYAPEKAEEFARLGHATMNTIADSDMLSIALINGFALGGGMELALACDIRLASMNAKMGLPEVGLGIIPGFGGTQRLPRVVGMSKAMELILSGDMISATEALRIGLVSDVTYRADLMAKGLALAEKVVKKGSSQAQKLAKWLIRSGLDVPLHAGLEKEITGFSELFGGKNPKEGMSAFLEKRKPKFEA